MWTRTPLSTCWITSPPARQLMLARPSSRTCTWVRVFQKRARPSSSSPTRGRLPLPTRVVAGNGYVVSAGSDLLVKVTVDAVGKLDFTGGISTTTLYRPQRFPKSATTQGEKGRQESAGYRDPRHACLCDELHLAQRLGGQPELRTRVESVLKLTNLPSPVPRMNNCRSAPRSSSRRAVSSNGGKVRSALQRGLAKLRQLSLCRSYRRQHLAIWLWPAQIGTAEWHLEPAQPG